MPRKSIFQTATPKRAFTGELLTLERAFAALVNTLADVFADKRVQGFEFVRLLGESGDVSTIIANFQPAAEYWKTLSGPEKEAEIKAFADSLQMPTADAAVKVGALFQGGAEIVAGLEKVYGGAKKVHVAFGRKWVAPEPETTTAPATGKAATTK